MSTVDLLQPLLTGGIQRNHFFNGRLLSAEDLRAEQQATRAHDRGLAQALGEGVAWGLEVGIAQASGPPTLSVAAGLGFNRQGDPVRLAAGCRLRLVAPAAVPPGAPADSPGLFGACEPPSASPLLLPESVWLLVATPVSAFEGSAPVADLNTTAAGRGHCGARWAVEGLRFRLVPVDPRVPRTLLPAAVDTDGTRQAAAQATIAALMADSSAAAAQRLRSLLALLALGHDRVPPGAARWGLADALAERGLLGACDLPLALLVLGRSGLRCLDSWAVRRPCHGRGAMSAWRAAGAGTRRQVEGEAAWLQFQEQLAGIGREAGVDAGRWFHALPGAAWLPPPWDWREFLGVHAPPAETPVDAALLRAVLQGGFAQDAIVFGRAPLAALAVYRAEGVPGVVVARAEAAELRLALSPAPSATQAVSVQLRPAAGSPAEASGHDRGRVRLAGLAPGEGVRVLVAAAGFEPPAEQRVRLVGGQVIELPLKLVPLAGGTLRVRALQADTGASIGRVLRAVQARREGESVDGRYDATLDRWLLRELPAGFWSVAGTAAGYEPAEQDKVGPIEPGETLEIVLLFSEARVRAERPALCVDVGGSALGDKGVLRELRELRLCLVPEATVFDATWYAKHQPVREAARRDPTLAFGLEQRRKAGRTRAEWGYTVGRDDGVLLTERGGPWSSFTEVATAPAAVRSWLRAWRDWFVMLFADEALARREPVLRVDPRYRRPTTTTVAGAAATTASGLRESPPAWADFGPFAVPVALKFDDGRTRAPVTLDKGARFLPEAELRLLAVAGIRHVDELAWSWTELLVDATGRPDTDLRLAVKEAQQAVVVINTGRSWVDGLKPDDNARLLQAGFDDDRKLYNATEAELTQALGSQYLARRVREQVQAAIRKPRAAPAKTTPTLPVVVKTVVATRAKPSVAKTTTTTKAATATKATKPRNKP